MRKAIPSLCLALLILAAGLAHGFEERTVKAAVAELEREKMVARTMFIGEAGSVPEASIALLVVLSDKDAVRTFTALAEKSGAPGLYGLIGLRIADQDGSLYTKKAQEFLAREKDKEVKTIGGCIVSTFKVEQLIEIPEASKNHRVLKHGEYAGQVFATGKDCAQAGSVIDNGVLPQILTVPGLDMAWVTAEKIQKSPDLAKMKQEYDDVVKQDLLFKNPTGILKLMGMDSEEKVMAYLSP